MIAFILAGLRRETKDVHFIIPLPPFTDGSRSEDFLRICFADGASTPAQNYGEDSKVFLYV
jgi:hypothetical protein